MDWPGLDRWGTSEDDALAKLESYLARYADVAERAGSGQRIQAGHGLEVVERVPGSSSTDFWGIAHVPSRDRARGAVTRRTLSDGSTCSRRPGTTSTTSRQRVSAELRPGARGGGRSRDEIVRHVYASERHKFWRKVEIRAR